MVSALWQLLKNNKIYRNVLIMSVIIFCKTNYIRVMDVCRCEFIKIISKLDKWECIFRKYGKQKTHSFEWVSWYLQGSNQGHMDFQSIALPSELRYRAIAGANIESFLN